MGRVVVGMDPHKRSATIEVIDAHERVLAAGRFGTGKAGYAEMLAVGREYPDRVWAVEGCNGAGRHLAHRLVHDGETVVDVPAWTRNAAARRSRPALKAATRPCQTSAHAGRRHDAGLMSDRECPCLTGRSGMQRARLARC